MFRIVVHLIAIQPSTEILVSPVVLLATFPLLLIFANVPDPFAINVKTVPGRNSDLRRWNLNFQIISKYIVEARSETSEWKNVERPIRDVLMPEGTLKIESLKG